jgi:hypothetical protein
MTVQHRRLHRRAPQFGFGGPGGGFGGNGDGSGGFGPGNGNPGPGTGGGFGNGGFGDGWQAGSGGPGAGDGNGAVGTDDPVNPSPTDDSSSTSTSASSATSTTPTTTTPLTSTTSTPSPVAAVTTAPPTTTSGTTPTYSTASLTSSAPATTSTGAGASTGLSTGAIVGGLGAGIVAIAAIGFAVAFFFRRARKQSDGFDPVGFRHSAVLLNDPPTHEDTIKRGFNPPMSEKYPVSPSPQGYSASAYSYEDQYNHADNRAGYGATGYNGQPYPIGQPISSSPISPNSTSQLVFPPALHNQSPLPSPYEDYSHYGQPAYPFLNEQPVVHTSLTRQPSAHSNLTRQTSARSNLSRQLSNPHPDPTPPRPDSIPADDYIDLNRSSISPFQAAQYDAISKRLNTSPPVAHRDLPPLPPADGPSPFDDPTAGPQQGDVDERANSPLTVESMDTEAYKFPVPPSPSHASMSRYRIDSMPPTLPTIDVQTRVSMGPAFGGFHPAPLGPSPLSAPPPAAHPQTSVGSKNKRSTQYSEDDAYGGF